VDVQRERETERERERERERRTFTLYTRIHTQVEFEVLDFRAGFQAFRPPSSASSSSSSSSSPQISWDLLQGMLHKNATFRTTPSQALTKLKS
jgi:hypothetical protein